MIQDNDGLQSLNEQENTQSSLANTEENKQNNELTNDLGNTTFTQEEIEQANKPQPNVILDKLSDAGGLKTAHRDTQRVSARANEASDPNDTNTGGIVSGAAKGASQS